MTAPLPPQLGGPALGRPISDSDEYERISSALNQMTNPAGLGEAGTASGKPYRNLLGFYNALLVGSILHVGKAAMSIVPTACVFIGKDGRLNMAFNPYYLDQIQEVQVAWPSSPAEQNAYQSGSATGKVWLVRPSFGRLPSFIRASILRGQLNRRLRQQLLASPQGKDIVDKLAENAATVDDLKTNELFQMLEIDQEEQRKIWAMGPADLGLPADAPVAVRVDNRRLIALCVHEILHVAHLHLLIDREPFKNVRIFGHAIDVAIDQFIDDVPDDLWVFWRDLFARCGEPPLQPDKSFDYYYAVIDDFTRRRANKTTQTPKGPITVVLGPMPPNANPGQGQGQPSPGQGQGQPSPGQGQGQPSPGQGQGQPSLGQGQGQPSPGQGQGQPDPGQGQGRPGQPGSGQGPGQPGSVVVPQPGQPGQGQPGPGPGRPGQGPPGTGRPGVGPDGSTTVYVPSTVDDHTVWGGNQGNVDQFAHAMWLQHFRDKAKERNEWGSELGDLLKSIDEFLKPRIRWQPLLKRFLGESVRIGKEGTRSRPSRRHGWEAPGKKTIRSGKILVAVDNSGSVSKQETAQFFGEISSFVDIVEVVVAIWDTAIRQVVKIQNKSQLRKLADSIGGGGGTDVHPVFKAVMDPSLVDDHKARSLLSNPTAIVVLTDGDLFWPSQDYDVRPTLWAITKESNLAGPTFGIPLLVDLQEK